MSTEQAPRRGSSGLRLNVYERALTEPRIRRVARKLGLSHFDVLGRMNHAWILCYQRRTEFLDVIDVDIATGELPGFVDAMVTEGLADRVDENTVRVRGAEAAIASLERQSEKGKRSGEVRRAMSAALQDRTTVQQRLRLGSTNGSAESRTPNASQATKTNRGSIPVEQAVEPGSDLISSDLHFSEVGDLDPDSSTLNDAGLATSSLPTFPLSGDTPAEKTQLSGAEEPTKRNRAKSPEPPEQAMTLAHLLLHHITTNNPGSRIARAADRLREATAERWAATIDKLHRIDKLEWGTIEGMILWCQRDSFWRGNILGADALRDHWDKMAAQRSRPAIGKSNGAAQEDPAARRERQRTEEVKRARERAEIEERDKLAAEDRDEVKRLADELRAKLSTPTKIEPVIP